MDDKVRYLLNIICYYFIMIDGNTPNDSRKQAEAEILRHMRAILKRVKPHNSKAKKKTPSNQSEEPVDKNHILSVVSRFTSLKQETKH